MWTVSEVFTVSNGIHIVAWICCFLAIVSHLRFQVQIHQNQKRDNSCSFGLHSAAFSLGSIATLIYNGAVAANPMFTDFLEKQVEGQYVLMTWYMGVQVFLYQYFGVIILAFSRIIALIFKQHARIQIWNGRVACFALGVQFVFPFLFATAFMMDDPQIAYWKHQFIWRNLPLFDDFTTIRRIIQWVTTAIVGIGFGIGFGKRIFMYYRWWKSPHTNQTRAPDVVHTVRVSESTLENDAVAYRPNVVPYVHQCQLPMSIIVFCAVLVQVALYTYMQREVMMGTSEELIVCSISSAAYPLMCQVFWSFPTIQHKLRHDRGFLCRLYRKYAGPTRRDVALTNVAVQETPGVTNIYQPRRNTISTLQ